MRTTVRMLVTCCALTAVCLAWRWTSVVRSQLSAPWDLVYESPNLCSIVLLKQHVNIYAESTYNAPPFVLTAYTPLYHYVVSLFPVDETNPFFFGRAVALAAFIGLAGLMVMQGRNGAARLACLFLAVMLLSTWPIMQNSAFLKNDSLGIFLAVSGMLLVGWSRTWPSLSVAGLLAVAAVATKQSYVTATIAAAVFLFVNDRRAFLKYCIAVAAWAALAAVFATVHFGSGFWFSIVRAQSLPFEWNVRILQIGFSQPLVSAFMLAAIVVLHGRVHRSGVRSVLQASPVFLYFVLAALQCLLTFGKTGTSTNCLFESLCAAALVLVESVRTITWTQPWSNKSLLFVGVFCLAAAADLSVKDVGRYSFASGPAQIRARSFATEYRMFVSRCGIAHPRVLNLSTHLGIVTLGLEPCFNDPWLYQQLWAAGSLPLEPFLAAIERQEYDVIIASSLPPEADFLAAETKIYAALARKYRVSVVDEEARQLAYVRAEDTP